MQTNDTVQHPKENSALDYLDEEIEHRRRMYPIKAIMWTIMMFIIAGLLAWAFTLVTISNHHAR
ncbi:MAG: hypothetical protein A3C06_01190 [Candidatus Taylorbacteria bacterium RIFCSPHIGHO2_02_FULL_46_13]|uniref:Uncharacterized protein n=1 Tax=Candidatus Taylorbacteria bacterium RIFCSPHIGHO2_02_FULL_46_13 TaxID=1802312 RepID=A0A1G2MT91_9BACT|nr:MAG: hypothetical protein A3C06_01190 [Candidatus Taylorbacteria bacterium RIFCSPHIGHO2_02_FULL_46_13]